MYQVMPRFPYGSASFGFGQDIPGLPDLPPLPEPPPTTPVARASTLPLLAVLAGGVMMVGGLTTQRVGTALFGGLLAGVGLAAYPWVQEAKRAVGLEGLG